jgi:hypothetical protein
MMETMKTDAVGVHFGEVLGQLRKGLAMAEASEELAKLVAEVRRTGNPGKLTLKLAVEPLDSDGTQVNVQDSLAVTLPRVKAAPTLFYTTRANGLSRRDPEQGDMFE